MPQAHPPELERQHMRSMLRRNLGPARLRPKALDGHSPRKLKALELSRGPGSTSVESHQLGQVPTSASLLAGRYRFFDPLF